MTSLPSSNAFFVGSASSSYSVRDAIESYRRAQYLEAETNICSSSDVEDFDNDDEEAALPRSDDIYDFSGSEDGETTPRADATEHFFTDQWDHLPTTPRHSDYLSTNSNDTPSPPLGRQPRIAIPIRINERSSLLRKSISFSHGSRPRRDSIGGATVKWNDPAFNRTEHRPIRRLSTSSDKVSVHAFGGRSTFGQTLFNATAILLGIGLLSEPLAFSQAGWIAGTLLIIFYGFITCYTAKTLSGLIRADPRIRSYSDIGRKAFGPRSSVFISLFFCLELFAVSVVLVTLYADSLHTVLPIYSSNTYKIWGLVLLIPTIFLPLSILSYASILGILSTVLMVVVIFYDGLSKTEAPGSLWSPADTSLVFPSWSGLGLSFGLFMAGFSGHAVIPSLAQDMMYPEQFDQVVNWAFCIATFLYAIIGYAGYLMFGANVSDEISVDLVQTPGYNPLLNKILLWMLVISPLTKFALTTQPMNVTIEVLFGLTGSLGSAEDQLDKQGFQSTGQGRKHGTIKRTLAVIQRICLTCLSVGVSIVVPEFSSVMGLLGSCFAFVICIIGPIAAKMTIAKKVEWYDAILLVISICMGVWGTGASIMEAREQQ